MARKKTDEDKAPCIIRPKDPDAWQRLLAQSAATHWRYLHIDIQMRDKLLGGKPKRLDAANAMLKARGLEDQIEALPDDAAGREEAARIAVDEGICEFPRRPDLAGIWFKTFQFKAGIKENWAVLGKRMKNWGSRQALAEGVFVSSRPAEDPQGVRAPGWETRRSELDWLYLGEQPDGIDTSTTHSSTPKGQIAAVKRHEYVLRPILRFQIKIARVLCEKIPDEDIADMLHHFGEHGLGASRSQDYGKFDILYLSDVGAIA